MIFARKEDEADLWLREHDPYYTDPDKNKRKKVSQPYDTPEQEKRRREMEIPLSNLSIKQAQSIGLEIDTDDRTGGILYHI